MIKPGAWVGLAFFLFSGLSFAEVDYKGELSFEGRQFKDDGNKQTEDSGAAFFGLGELTYQGEFFDLKFRGFGRYDGVDNTRKYFILEDAYYRSFMGEEQEWTFVTGYKVFNWTAMEAFHPVDQINSRNFDSPLENLEKKGELTVEINGAVGDGEIAIYVWPKYESPRFPNKKGRLGLGANIADPVYIDEDRSTKEFGIQYGARISQVFDDLDLSLHYLHHMDRNFPIVGTENHMVHPTAGLIPLDTPNKPYYFTVDQFGGTLQWVLDSHIIKMETAARLFSEELAIYTLRGLRKPVDHQESAVGWEYSVGHDGGTESFVFVEANFLTGVNKETRSELSPFQRDMLLAYRYAFNDKNSREFFASFIFDMERSHEYFASLSYSQRLGESWKLTGGLRYYDAPKKQSVPKGLEIFHQDSQVSVKLSRFF